MRCFHKLKATILQRRHCAPLSLTEPNAIPIRLYEDRLVRLRVRLPMPSVGMFFLTESWVFLGRPPFFFGGADSPFFSGGAGVDVPLTASALSSPVFCFLESGSAGSSALDFAVEVASRSRFSPVLVSSCLVSDTGSLGTPFAGTELSGAFVSVVSIAVGSSVGLKGWLSPFSCCAASLMDGLFKGSEMGEVTEGPDAIAVCQVR